VPEIEADTGSVEVVTDSPERTQQLGENIGRLIQPGDVICLSGELGAGKTTLAKGIGHGWGAVEVVTSPTFVFVNEYTRADGGRLYHADVYRLKDAADAESIALADILSDMTSTVLIEWPERVKTYLPEARLWVELMWESEGVRRIRGQGVGARYDSFLEAVSKA